MALLTWEQILKSKNRFLRVTHSDSVSAAPQKSTYFVFDCESSSAIESHLF